MKYKVWSFVICSSAYFFALPLIARAYERFITIVNPVRISTYSTDTNASILSQYNEVVSRQFSATWLLTFDVLKLRPPALAKFNRQQEIGVFMEVTPELAQAAGVKYKSTGSWHHANSVFLIGYTPADRLKMIDTLMEEYKIVFGKYPLSVGAWWIDSFSLDYMHNKYGVIAHLTCSDQYSTDGYQIWGTYWSTPYYPSLTNTALPASSLSQKLDIVALQWAPRDPLNGYYDSTYSTQDYFTRPKQDISYFDQLVDVYLNNPLNNFGQITVGLEGDFPPQTYKGEYAKQLSVIAKKYSNDIEVVTMSQFAQWYRDKFPRLSPPQIISSHTPETTATWYQSPVYRVGWVKSISETRLRDLRVYYSSPEAFYSVPNEQNILFSHVFSVFDEISDKRRVWNLSSSAEVVPDEQSLLISDKHLQVPEFIKNNSRVKVTYLKENKVQIKFVNTPLANKTISSYGSETRHILKSPRQLFQAISHLNFDFLKKHDYQISGQEIEALTILRMYPAGKVLVANTECLQCAWHDKLPPIEFVNDRAYVGEYSGKKVIYDPGVLSAPDRATAKNILSRLGVRYIYLAKLESYIEKLAFSPGDYGVKPLFENASAQIWEVEN